MAEYCSTCTTTSLSIHLFDGQLGGFLAIVNNAAVNIGIHVSFSIVVSSGCMHSSGIVESYGSSGLSCGSVSKESAHNAGDLGLIPGLGRSPGGGHGNPLQDSWVENPYEQRSPASYSPWVTKSQTRLNSQAQHTAQHGSFIPSFLRTLHIILQSACN